MTSPLCIPSSALASPALLFHLVDREWRTEVPLPSCSCCKMSSSSAPARQSHWSSSLCQFKRTEDAYPALWEGWQVIWGRWLTWTREQHWRQGKDCTGEVFLAGY